MGCLLLLALAAGCGRQEPAGRPGPAATERLAGVRRIVSLAPNLTEILFALHLGDQVVGVTDYCNYPPEALEKPRVGGFVNPDLEAVVGLEPDLVVATPNAGNREGVLRLRSLGIELLIVDPDDLEGLYTTIRRIAARAGVPERGESLAGRLSRRVASIRARTGSLPPARSLLVFSRDPLIVAGPGTFFDELLGAAGGENVAAGTGAQFPQFSLEEIVRRGPEVIIDTDMGAGEGSAAAFWSRWTSIPAVRDGRICTPPPDVITRPGPRVAEGLRLLAQCLHPGILERGEHGGAPAAAGP